MIVIAFANESTCLDMKLGTQTTTGWLRLRSLMTVLCVSVFVLSGVVHSICCVDGPAGTATQMSTQTDGDTSNAPGALELPDGTHCHGCASASLPLVELAISPSHAAGALTPPQHDALTASQLQFDPPPPKTLT